MSFTANFQKFSKPTPPERGSFPLDHEGECKIQMKAYVNCLKSSTQNTEACRLLSMEYLKCRMEKGLMDKDDFKNLGFADEQSEKSVNTNSSTPLSSTSKSKS